MKQGVVKLLDFGCYDKNACNVSPRAAPVLVSIGTTSTPRMKRDCHYFFLADFLASSFMASSSDVGSAISGNAATGAAAGF